MDYFDSEAEPMEPLRTLSQAESETFADAMSHTHVERPVKIYSYCGSLPDHYGQDGDFYVDELMNMLYGPKTAGIWPEEGVPAAGVSKRTWIGGKFADANKPSFNRRRRALFRRFFRWLGLRSM